MRLVESWGSDERIIEAARMSTAKGFLGQRSASLYLPERYVDAVLAAAGWTLDGTVSDLGRDMQKWRLVLPDASPEEAAE